MLGICGVVLVGVLVYQFVIAGGPDTPSPPPATPKAAPPPETPGAPPATVRPSAPPEMTDQERRMDELTRMLSDVETVRFDYREARIARDPTEPLHRLIRGAGETGEMAAIMPPPRRHEILSKRITGIVWDPQAPMAVVDDEVVYPGYVYPNGIAVAGIEQTRVIFRINDTEIPVDMEGR